MATLSTRSILLLVSYLHHSLHVCAQNRPFTLKLFDQEIATKYNARCLDGSIPGYYYKPAANAAASSKWKIHFRGGGWCFNLDDCYSRISGSGGSSKYYNPDVYDTTEGVYGLLNDNATNPFGDFHAVFAEYCDGSSWTGARETPLLYNKTTEIWLRGYYNLVAFLEDLEVNYQFKSATSELIVTGTSAGGMATALHSSFLKASLSNSSAFLVAVPDAGWWWDALTVNNQHLFAAGFQAAYGPSFWNSSQLDGGAAILPQTCLQTTPVSLQWQCYLPDYIYNTTYSTVDGVFVMQSLYDSAQLGMEYDLGCDPYTSCSSTQLAEMQSYRDIFETRIVTHQDTSPYNKQGQPLRDGRFMTACYQHEESCRDFDWYGILIHDNTTGIAYNANQTFSAWYQYRQENREGEGKRSGGGENGRSRSSRSTATTTPFILADVRWPNNPTCAPQGVKHGGC